MNTDFDTGAAAAWMAGRVPRFAGPIRAQRIPGGQSNPTFLIEAASGRYVLRRKPPGVLLKSAHAIEREFRVQRALATTRVPVPQMHALCDDDSVIGSAFYVMSHVAGRSFTDPALPGLNHDDRTRIMDEMNRVMAAIHTINPTAAGLGDYGPGSNYYARQLARWTGQYRATETEHLPGMEELIAWLGANLPADDGRITLVHGDMRLDNLLFARDAPVCIAVLDWELSTLGHPFADLAACLMQWQMPPGVLGRGLAGLDRDALGLPSDTAFVDAYCRRTDLPGIPHFGFCLAFAFFRMAAILQGVRKRALDGNAADPAKGLQMGALVPDFAQGGLRAAHGA